MNDTTIKWTKEAIEKAELVNAILTEKDKETAKGIIEALRKDNMMGDALGIVARRFALSLDAVACWYYVQFYGIE